MDAATVKCRECRFWLRVSEGERGVCRVHSTGAENMPFRAVLETAPEFGCDSGVRGDPRLPVGWDLDRLLTLVRETGKGKAKMTEMLMMLGVVETQEDGLKVIHKKAAPLGKSLRGAGWTRQDKKGTGGPWLLPPE